MGSPSAWCSGKGLGELGSPLGEADRYAKQSCYGDGSVGAITFPRVPVCDLHRAVLLQLAAG